MKALVWIDDCPLIRFSGSPYRHCIWQKMKLLLGSTSKAHARRYKNVRVTDRVRAASNH